MDKKVIDLFERKIAKNDPALVQAIEYLAGLDDQTRAKIVAFIGATILRQVEEGLGLEEKGDIDLVGFTDGIDYFEEIDRHYKRVREDCYFCDPAVDATQSPFHIGSDPVCKRCVEKIASFFEAIGGKPASIRTLFSEVQDGKN